MMKLKYLVIVLFMIFIFPIGVLADGNVSVSTSKINITKGGSSSFTITADNSAGRIDISSSNSGVANVSETSLFLDMNSSTIVVSGKSVGTATITVYASDVTTYDDEDLSGRSYTISVTVSEPVNNSQNNSTVNKKLSDNNNVSSISVEGYELEKIDNNNFALSVNNNVTSVNIKAITEDSKASVAGDGLCELSVGENVVEIIVTSESGKQNKYFLNITRKDGYYLDDLTSVIGNLAQKDINVKIGADSIITSDILEKIKDSGKRVNLNYSDDNNKLIYSWLIDGNMLEGTDEFLTSVSYISEYKNEIEALSNYADGLYVNIKNNNSLPSGTIIKLHVGDKFDDGNIVKLYCYDNEKNNLNEISDDINVVGKYIEFDVNNCSNYFVTKSNIKPAESGSNLLNIFIIVGIIVVIICFIIILLSKKRHNKENSSLNNKSVNNNSILDNNIVNNSDINDNEKNSINISDVEEKLDVDYVSNNVVDNFSVNNETIDLDENDDVSVNNEIININSDVVDNSLDNSNVNDKMENIINTYNAEGFVENSNIVANTDEVSNIVVDNSSVNNETIDLDENDIISSLSVDFVNNNVETVESNSVDVYNAEVVNNIVDDKINSNNKSDFVTDKNADEEIDMSDDDNKTITFSGVNIDLTNNDDNSN